MKRKLGSILRIVVSLGLLALLYRNVDFTAMRATFAQIAPLWLIPIFAILFANTAISALKWRWLLQANGLVLPWGRLTANYLIASFFSLFLPSNIGGDAYRVYTVAKEGAGAAKSFASVLADRLSGFIALVLLGLTACLLGRAHLPDQKVLLIPLAALALLATATFFLLQQRLARGILAWKLFDRIPKLRGFGEKLLDAVQSYRESPGLFLRIMGLSFLFQINAILCIWMLAQALALPVAMKWFWMFVPIISLMESLPISIFGLGIRDVFYVYFFVPVGLEKPQALAMAMGYVAMTVLYCAAGGVLFMLRKNSASGPSGSSR